MEDSAFIPSPEINQFSIGPLTVHFYALFILLGIGVAAMLINGRLQQRGIDSDFTFDLVLVLVPSGIIGARIYHVLTTYPDYFGEGKNWLDIFAIWKGGLAIFGGVIGGAIGLWILTRIRKIGFMQILDIIAPPMILAQAIGRLGNYFNQELFGLPTDLPWGLTISDNIATRTFCEPEVYCSAGLHYHPTFLYEMLWNIAGFALLLFLERRLINRLRTGQLFCLYVIYYAIGRIWIEALRINYSTYFLGLRINIWGAIVAGITAWLLFVYLNKRHLRAEL